MTHLLDCIFNRTLMSKKIIEKVTPILLRGNLMLLEKSLILSLSAFHIQLRRKVDLQSLRLLTGTSSSYSGNCSHSNCRLDYRARNPIRFHQIQECFFRVKIPVYLRTMIAG